MNFKLNIICIFILLPIFNYGQIVIIEDPQTFMLNPIETNGPTEYTTILLPEINGFELSFQIFVHPPHFDSNQVPLSNAYVGIANPSGMRIARSIGPSSPNFYDVCDEFGNILNSGLDQAWVFTLGEELPTNPTYYTTSSLIYSEQFYDASLSLPDAFCGNYYSTLPGINQTYTGFRVSSGGNYYYGWIDGYEEGGYLYHFNRIAIETSPDTPIIAGDVGPAPGPEDLNQTYTQSPQGIYLNWAVFPDAQACQVRGGPIGGNDPHNFIISTAPYNQLFINGNSLTVGEEYQWKVRCATGVNPYSGVSDWSEYDYFIYEP